MLEKSISEQFKKSVMVFDAKAALDKEAKKSKQKEENVEKAQEKKR
jgi:hypothetical protein